MSNESEEKRKSVRELPSIIGPSQRRLHVICEGKEDKMYFDTLINLGVWNKDIIIDTEDAMGNTNIKRRYESQVSSRETEEYFQTYIDARRSEDYDAVIIFCDTGAADNSRSRGVFRGILDKTNTHNGTTDETNDVVYYANPVTMQIILSHFKKVSITSENKYDYEKLVYECCGVEDFASLHSEAKLNEIMKQINRDNYNNNLKENLKDAPKDYRILNSTNILDLFFKLESSDVTWIDKIGKTK